MKSSKTFLLAVAWAAVLCLSVPARADIAQAQAWRQQVASVSVGTDGPARAAAIAARLDALSIAWEGQDFEAESRSGQRMAGRNLLADLGGPSDAPLLLIGAHYDRVDAGHGAMDNASGVATVLALAQAFKQRPLAHHRVQVAFWDLEEHGLLGSKAWVGTPGRAAPALYVNFDVFGWGDTLWMMDPEVGASALAQHVRLRSEPAGLGFRAGDHYPPTDHLAFQQVKWPAVSFSLMDAAEVDGTLAIFAGQKPESPPKVMRIIHTEGDTLEALEPEDVPLALQVLEASLRDWDAVAP